MRPEPTIDGPKPLDEQVADIRNTVIYIAESLGAALPLTDKVLIGLGVLTKTITSCKHCGEQLKKVGADWFHASGPQTNMHRCAVEPYGFHAEPMGTPCIGDVNPCNGFRGIEQQVSRPSYTHVPSDPNCAHHRRELDEGKRCEYCQRLDSATWLTQQENFEARGW